MITSNSELSSSTSMKNDKSKLLSRRCQICGNSAEYFYFGVLSCRSCKMFFRRNGNTEQTKFTCNYNSQCEINVNNRRVCASCRLAKCFKCGMKTDKFRASISTHKKSNRSKKIKITPTTNIICRTEMKQEPERLPTLNLLQSDQSLLSTSQWTLLSNLCNSYHESNLLSISQRLMGRHDDVQSSIIIDNMLIKEFLTSIYETAGTYLRLNSDLCKLSSNDRPVLLRSAADNVSCMSCVFLINYCHLCHLDTFSNIMEAIYGKHSVDLHLWATKFIDPDIVLFKLALSLFAFAENTYSYSRNISRDATNSLIILEIQNKYAEVTWKYLLYKYGYYQAVKRFLRLTIWLGVMTVVMFHAQTLKLHVNDINSLVEQTELSLILDDIEQTTETS